MIHSVAGALAHGELSDRRPYRAPHHSASMPALVGGGVHARPGEISLAHNGVLFLDELPEFATPVLDSLRQPLETGQVAIARANHRVTYPARFQLIAAMNPCRCGHALDPGFACRRQPVERCVAGYVARLSGPLLDRIDLHIEVPAVSAADLLLPPPAEGSAEVAVRVARARAAQTERYRRAWSSRGHHQCRGACDRDRGGRSPGCTGGTAFVRTAAEKMRLSARGFHRVLKLARTLADLEGAAAGPPRASRRGAVLSPPRSRAAVRAPPV